MACPKELRRVATRKLDQLDSAELLDELKIPPGNRLEARTGDRAGQHSIRIHVPYQRVNELINGKRGVTPATALRLAKVFGNTAGFWLNLQSRWDLYHARRAEQEMLKRIVKLKAAS